MPIPEWFTKALDVKLALIQQHDSNGKFTFYTQHQNFWVPQKAKWFQMRNAKVLKPEILYNFELFLLGSIAFSDDFVSIMQKSNFD